MPTQAPEPIDPAKICKTCRHWSQWLPRLGDCMEYAERRRELWIKSEAPSEVPPHKPAIETEPDHGCGNWSASKARADHA